MDISHISGPSDRKGKVGFVGVPVRSYCKRKGKVDEVYRCLLCATFPLVQFSVEFSWMFFFCIHVYRVFLLSFRRSLKSYDIGVQHLPRHRVTAAVFRTAIKETRRLKQFKVTRWNVIFKERHFCWKTAFGLPGADYEGSLIFRNVGRSLPTRNDILRAGDLNQYCCEKLKSHTYTIFCSTSNVVSGCIWTVRIGFKQQRFLVVFWRFLFQIPVRATGSPDCVIGFIQAHTGVLTPQPFRSSCCQVDRLSFISTVSALSSRQRPKIKPPCISVRKAGTWLLLLH